MGWLITICVLTLLAILPIGITAVYNSQGPVIRMILGPFRFVLYPAKKRKRSEQRPSEKRTVGGDFESRKTLSKKPAGKLSDSFPLLQAVFEFLSDFKRKLRIDRLEMKLILAGDDPCDLAVNYGRAWAVLGNLMPQLERLFVIRKRDLEVACDFTSNETHIDARADLTISLGSLLIIVLYHGIRVLCRYFKIFNKSKAVQ